MSEESKYKVVRLIPDVAEIIIAEDVTHEEALKILQSQPVEDIAGDPSSQPKLKIERIG